MDQLALIKQPIEQEFQLFTQLFNYSMTFDEGLLSQVLSHIRQRGGKRMRPILMFLIAKNYGDVNQTTQNAAIGLELLHTASLVHDDVVDESEERRGQASVNASFDNKAAVLVGDYILSTALLNVSYSNNRRIIENLAEVGRVLASGELLQLSNTQNEELSEEVYFKVISQKTAVLFEACASIGALSVNASETDVKKASDFGRNLGIIFQIRDDIFDYYDSREIGKPTGNDMAEGKLTLPAIYALQHSPYESMLTLANKVKAGTINADEIAVLVEFTKNAGGIEYAERKMDYYHQLAQSYIDESVEDACLKQSLTAYLDYVINRTK